MAVKKSKIFTVASVKGGVGKTTTVLNLAGVFASMKKKVLIIDMDLYTGSIAASLNVGTDRDLYKLVNDLNNNRFDYIENYVLPYQENIDVLAAPKDPRYASKINSKFLSVVFARAEMRYDVILVDTNHMMDEINLVVMDASDQILYIVTNDPIALKNMRTMVAIYKDMEKDNYKIILNESSDKVRDYFSKIDMRNIIQDNIDYTIPASFYIKNIDKYVMDGSILTLTPKIVNTHKKAMKNFELMATSLLKETKNEK